MKRIRYSFVALVWVLGTAKASDNKAILPQIGIAPSHITIPTGDLFRRLDLWQETAGAIQLYKYYGVQAVHTPWATPLDPDLLVKFAQPRNVQIECEFGNFFLPLKEHDSVKEAIAEIKPIYDAGGKVSFMSLDGPDCRLLKGIQKQADALSLDELGRELVRFWKGIHAVYPGIRIGLISNYPNWDFSPGLPGYNGDNTALSGITVERMLDSVYTALIAAGENLGYVEIDNPCNYYISPKTRAGKPHSGAKNMHAIQNWCRAHKVGFHLILNAEPRKAKDFHDLTLQFVLRLHDDAVFPDVFLIQSWYKEPSKNVPETEAHTFMNTARDAIRAIRESYRYRKE